MEIRINKNLLPPIIITLIALIIGGVVLLSNKNQPNPGPSARKLELAVPGMFCAGCTANVGGTLSSVPGVEFAEARLTPRKSATVIYNPNKITKEEIVKNKIFDTYGPATIISDEPFQGSAEQLKQTKTALPASIQEKTNRVSELLAQKQREGIDTTAVQKKFEEVNNLLSSGRYQEAERLLDDNIKELENL